MRSIALDIHQSFCEVAIREAGETRSAGRIATDRAELELFARSLDPGDQVAMEIARIIEPHAAGVIVVNAQEVRAISHARAKSDRFDVRAAGISSRACALARRLRAPASNCRERRCRPQRRLDRLSTHEAGGPRASDLPDSVREAGCTGRRFSQFVLPSLSAGRASPPLASASRSRCPAAGRAP